MNKKKLIVMGLAFVLAFAPVLTVSAADADTEAALSNAQNTVSTLEDQKAAITGTMDDLQSQLVVTLAGIDSADSKISDLQAQMEVTGSDLADAQADQDSQYEAMKKRIQYLYETGGEAGWATVFLEDGDISDILTKAEYTEKMYQYDRDCLEKYAETVKQVQTLQEQQRSQEATLEEQKNQLVQAQSQLNTLLDQAKAQYTDYDAKLQEAYAKAAEYQTLVTQQNVAIAQIVSEQQAQAASAQSESTYVGGQTDYAVDNTPTYDQVQQAVSSGDYSQLSSTTGLSGADVLAYAQQFLGGAYVWGGTNLSTGVDCSGFVQQVYKNFGVDLSRTSYSQMNDGVAVSYSDVQVGDIIVYDGHVGIYAGNGQIINAANEEQGICYTPANYDTILSVRRVTG